MSERVILPSGEAGYIERVVGSTAMIRTDAGRLIQTGRFRCDSGLSRPESLLEGDWAYGVAHCGFVVRAPREPYMRGESTELQDALRAHTKAVHPAKYEQDRINDAMSKD